MKLLLSFLFSILFLMVLNGQQIVFSTAIKNNSFTNFTVVGKVGDKMVVYEYNNALSLKKLLLFDEQMKLVKTQKIHSLPNHATNVEFVINNEMVWVIYKTQYNQKVYYNSIKLNTDLKPVGEPVILDSVQQQNTVMNIVYSNDKSKILIYSLVFFNNESYLSTKIYNSSMQLLHKTTFPFFFNPATETLSSFNIANNGNIYFLIFPFNLNNQFQMDRFEIVSTIFKSDEFKSTQVALAGKKLNVTMNMEINNLTDKLFITSFYYAAANTKIQGLFCVEFDIATQKMKNEFTPFAQDVYEQLGYSVFSDTDTAYFVVHDIVPRKKGGFILLAEIEKAYEIKKTGYDRYRSVNLNNVITNPRDFRASDFDEPVSIAIERGGLFSNNRLANSNVEYVHRRGVVQYDQIVLMYVNANMGLEKTTVITKNQQHAILAEKAMSFFTFTSSNNLQFLYNDVTVKDVNVYHGKVSASGEIENKATLKLDDKNYQLLPGVSKQIAANRVLLGFNYRGKTFFGRLDF